MIALLFLKCTQKWVNGSSLKDLKILRLIFFFFLSFPFIMNINRLCSQPKNSCLLSHIILCHVNACSLRQYYLSRPSTLRKNRYKSSLHLFASNVSHRDKDTYRVLVTDTSFLYYLTITWDKSNGKRRPLNICYLGCFEYILRVVENMRTGIARERQEMEEIKNGE